METLKTKLKYLVINYIKYDGITATFAVVVILGIYISQRKTENIIDWTIFSSIVVTLALAILSSVVKKILMNHLEDSNKLTEDYDALTRKYMGEMVAYDNSCVKQENKKKIESKHVKVTIPVIQVCELSGHTICIRDTKKEYELPELIQSHFDEIFTAHSTSDVFNQVNIRVDDWKESNGDFVICTSRTTFFNSLVTNRAMDYKWSNGVCVRDMLECGPQLHTLKESLLSNHLGFNGFIESVDNYILFVKRKSTMSLGKRLYESSVGASLGTKDALNEYGIFTTEGLQKGILKALKDELEISGLAIDNFSLEKNMISAYRELVEGGKPQLLFYVHSSWTKAFIEKNYAQKKHLSQLIWWMKVRKTFLWIPKSELKYIGILPDGIIYRGKKYRMMPTVTASVVMLMKYLGKK